MGMTSNNFLGIKLIDLSDNGNVADSGGTDTQTSTPPEGQIYKLNSIEYYAADPAGSTSGTHQVVFRIDIGTTNDLQKVYLNSNTGGNVQINNGIFYADTIAPSGDAAEIPALRGWMWSKDYPLNCIYTNNTDATQTANRRCYILVEVYKAAL